MTAPSAFIPTATSFPLTSPPPRTSRTRKGGLPAPMMRYRRRNCPPNAGGGTHPAFPGRHYGLHVSAVNGRRPQRIIAGRRPCEARDNAGCRAVGPRGRSPQTGQPERYALFEAHSSRPSRHLARDGPRDKGDTQPSGRASSLVISASGFRPPLAIQPYGLEFTGSARMCSITSSGSRTEWSRT
jgi:hypothetical protein